MNPNLNPYLNHNLDLGPIHPNANKISNPKPQTPNPKQDNQEQSLCPFESDSSNCYRPFCSESPNGDRPDTVHPDTFRQWSSDNRESGMVDADPLDSNEG